MAPGAEGSGARPKGCGEGDGGLTGPNNNKNLEIYHEYKQTFTSSIAQGGGGSFKNRKLGNLQERVVVVKAGVVVVVV